MFVAPFASSDPDGLERTAAQRGFAQDEQSHALEDGPLSGYEIEGIDDPKLSTALAGALGVIVTFLMGLGVFAVLRRRARSAVTSEEQAE